MTYEYDNFITKLKYQFSSTTVKVIIVIVGVWLETIPLIGIGSFCRQDVTFADLSDNAILNPQSYFEEETVAAVKKLLPESAEGDLASVCSWPDEIKHHWQWRWTSPLHYVDTPDYRCNYEYCRRFILLYYKFLTLFNFFHIRIPIHMFCLCEGDCHDTHKHQDRCVTGAIFNYTMQLMSASKNSQTIVHCE